jgi:hypothetical protein
MHVSHSGNKEDFVNNNGTHEGVSGVIYCPSCHTSHLGGMANVSLALEKDAQFV